MEKFQNKTATPFETLVLEYVTFVTEDEMRIVEIVVDLTICFIISLIGVFTNVMIMAVFAKQGFKDSVGITMTTIAFWDLVKCLGAMVQRLRGPISLWDAAAAASWSNISVVVFNYLVSFSSYVTSVLAAYVAVERCLCVSMPLMVKRILTFRVTLFACIVISVVVFGCFAMMFGIYDIVWVMDLEYNTTIAVYRFNSFAKNNTLLFEYYNLSGILWPMASLLVIVISSVIISFKLGEAAKIRFHETSIQQTKGYTNPSSSDSKKSTNVSRRDQKVVKMLLVIIVIYIINLFPRVAVYMAKYIVYEFYFLRRYHYLFLTVSYAVYVFDLSNGAANLFVFLAMSTSFRETFFVCFKFFKLNQKNKMDKHRSNKNSVNESYR